MDGPVGDENTFFFLTKCLLDDPGALASRFHPVAKDVRSYLREFAPLTAGKLFEALQERFVQ